MSRSTDDEHLRLLAIFHYIYAGFTALFSFCPSFYIVMGVIFLNAGPMNNNGRGGPPPPAEVGWIFIVMGSFGVILMWGLAILSLVAGRKIAARKNRIFCFVVAVIESLNMPIGTALGVCTLIVINRQSVVRQFEGPPEIDEDDDWNRSERRPETLTPPSDGVQEL